MKKFSNFLTIGSRYFLSHIVLAILCGFYCSSASAQSCPATATTSINSYPSTYFPASQANVPAGSTSIVLGAATYGSTPVNPGDILLIIQMQGAQINPGNTSAYGDGTGAASGYISNAQLLAGNMEYIVATSPLSTSGGTLTIMSGLAHSYQNTPFGTDGQYTYQVIRIPVYYDLQLTGPITAPRWDGFSGGVLVLYATDMIQMNGQTIDASGLGFRGGGGRVLSGASTGSYDDFFTISSTNDNGSKGEGIAGSPKYINAANSLSTGSTEGYPNGSNGRGAPANAGGGGTDGNPASNDRNTGGGGGANGGAGGSGGWAWSTSIPSGGKGGSVFTQGTASRLIMGGGGGAGTTNDGTGTPGSGFASSGAAGGGIIILSAQNGITGTGTIKSNGASANSTVQNDGTGGGGAGGTILIYSGNGIASNLTVSANGGAGGSNEVSGGPSHGPGGGGGGGVIYSNASLASSLANGGSAGTTNATSTNFGATNGSNGLVATTMSQSDPAQVPLNCMTLGVSFISLSAVKNNSTTDLKWVVSREVNTLQYIIERSTDGVNFSIIGSMGYQEGSAADNAYTYTDTHLPAISGQLYYRIREIDADGRFVYSKMAMVQLSMLSGKLSVYPNPARSSLTVSFITSSAGAVSLRLFDMKAALLWQKQYNAVAGQNTLQVDIIRSLPIGTYVLQWFDGLQPEQIKIMVE